MATVTVNHNPHLTADQAMEVFRSHFAGRYEVYKTRLAMRDFVVKKSGWTGVGVRLRQNSNTTSFVFTGFSPATMVRVLHAVFIGLGALIVLLVIRPSWKSMEEEIRAFIDNSAYFKPASG